MAECRRLAEEAAAYPVIHMESYHPEVARDYARRKCHEIALSHGLPEIPGYYGIDAKGEFVAAE